MKTTKQTLQELLDEVEVLKANQKVPYQALKLSGGCPDCGAEVNQSFVDNEFKEAVDQALDTIATIIKRKIENL